MALRTRFSRPTWSFWGLQARFWRAKTVDFRRFLVPERQHCVQAPKSTKHWPGWRNLRFGLSTMVPKNDENSIRTSFALRNDSQKAPGAVPGVVWTAPGRQLGLQDDQHGAQDGQLSIQDRPTWRPGRVPSASRNAFGRPKRPKIDFSSIFGRFGTDFRRLFDRFFAVCTSKFVSELLRVRVNF